MKPQRTPQEKKRLSYKKDRRNRYGESDKASRRLIPRYKAKARRAVRHTASGIAREGLIEPESTAQDRAEARTKRVDKTRWEKAPGVSLPDAIAHSREWRVRRFKRKQDHDVSDAKLQAEPEGILRPHRKSASARPRA